MITVRFYEQVEDHLLQFAVIVSKHRGRWVFCKHRDRSTYECPGGHREAGEPIEAAARRELWEETGAKEFDLTPVCVYSVARDGSPQESFGMLYFAAISAFEALPELEIERIELFEQPPDAWTYPEIQPLLLQKVAERFGAEPA